MTPHQFVVFGATGDLMRRKLLPALYARRDHDAGQVVGVGSADLDDPGFRALGTEALVASGVPQRDAAAWADERLGYVQVGRDQTYDHLAQALASRDPGGGNRVLYLALPAEVFPSVVDRLGAAGLHRSAGWTRIVVEKPFGTDLGSAAALNATLHTWFDESQIFRIDHYLGKETVQNLLVFRFTNPIFEASWNRDRVERVEITVAETVGVGTRGSSYDGTGVVRDMLQSHLTQVLSLIAMEAPSGFTATAIRDEKVKVLRSIREIPHHALRLGQYTAGRVAGVPVPGYRESDEVPSDSATATFAATRVWIDNWRWQGVPFFLRTGKAMARRVTEVAVAFRRPPICLFHGVVDDCIASNDVLRLVLQPDEGFSLEIDVKEPGDSTRLHPVPLRFSYAEEFGRIPDAYETLLGDVVEGDQTLFVRSDEVEESWRLFTPLVDAPVPVEPYPAGSWGPEAAKTLLPEGVPGWATGV